MREKIDNLFSSKTNRNKTGYQPILSPKPSPKPGARKRRASPDAPLPLITYSARGGCPTRHRPDLTRHNSSDEDVTAYMEKKVDLLMRDSNEKGWRVMVSSLLLFCQWQELYLNLLLIKAHYSTGHGKTLTFPMNSEKIDKLLTELEALVMVSLPRLHPPCFYNVIDTSFALCRRTI